MSQFCIKLLSVSALVGCATSSHPTRRATLGTVSSSDEFVRNLEQPGPIDFERVVAADWAHERGGLINLDHPKAKAARLEEGEESMQIYFYALTHPEHGTFLVDSGVEEGFTLAAGNPRLGSLVANGMNLEKLVIRTTTRAWLEQNETKLAGVLLTHMHLDHVMGLPDLAKEDHDKDTPVYSGPGEAGNSKFLNLFVQGTTDRLLEGLPPIREWEFAKDPSGRFEGVLDVLGDGSLWAIYVPGHTPGSTAYLVRSTDGPKLMVGDACHTRWGWEDGVEPGDFSDDKPRSAQSLRRLLEFSKDHPSIEVFLGHQP